MGAEPVYCSVASQFHAAGCLGYSNYMAKKNASCAVKLIFFRSSFLSKKVNILGSCATAGEGAEVNEIDECGFSLVRFIFALIARVFSKSDVVYVSPSGVSPKILSEIVRREGFVRVRFVKIDEGVGSYSGFASIAKACLRESNGVLSAMKLLVIYSIRGLLGAFFLHEKWRLINGNSKAVVSEYIRSFEDLSDGELLADGSCVFLGQPLVELNHTSIESYFELLKKVKIKAESLGFSFVVKPHPFESVGKYSDFDFSVISGDSVIESQISKDSKRIMVVGFASTSLVTLSLLYGVDCYRISANGLRDEALDRDVIALINKHAKVLSIGD